MKVWLLLPNAIIFCLCSGSSFQCIHTVWGPCVLTPNNVSCVRYTKSHGLLTLTNNFSLWIFPVSISGYCGTLEPQSGKVSGQKPGKHPLHFILYFLISCSYNFALLVFKCSKRGIPSVFLSSLLSMTRKTFFSRYTWGLKAILLKIRSFNK